MKPIRHIADVDRADKIVFGLTAAQLVKLGSVATTLFVAVALVHGATHSGLLTGVLFFFSCALFGAAFALVVSRRDGVALDRWLLQGVRQRLAPSVMVPAPGGVVAEKRLGGQGNAPAPLSLPGTRVLADGSVDLGDQGCAVLCRASSLTFSLRTDVEQEGLITAFGEYLNGLSAPIQVVVRSEPADIGGWADQVEQGADTLASPALQDAARAHAAFLRTLGEGKLRRSVLIALREAQRAASGDLARQRAETAEDDLSAAGIRLTVLEHSDAVSALATAMNPGDARRVRGGARLHEPIGRAVLGVEA